MFVFTCLWRRLLLRGKLAARVSYLAAWSRSLSMLKKIEPVANQAVGTQHLLCASLYIRWWFTFKVWFTGCWLLQLLGFWLVYTLMVQLFCRRLGWLTPTSYITRTRATTAVIGERKVIPTNVCASEAVFCWIYIICLSIKWAKLGITLQRWNIMICVMHFWELRCCFIGERLASSISLLAS